MAKNQLNHLIQLDGVRFIAVGLVLFDHWMAERVALPLGALGVTIFFVLSGFLIVRILLASKDKLADRPGGGLGTYLKTFYIRRSLRIFPIYYLTLFVLLFFEEHVRQHFWWLALYATNIYIVVYNTWLGTTDHLWSLAVEEQVYLIFPLLLFFLPRRYVLPAAVLMIVGAVGLRYVFYRERLTWFVQYVSTPTCLDAFGLGAIMAFGWLYAPTQFRRVLGHRALLPLSVVLFLFIIWAGKQFPGQHHNVVTDVWERLAGSVFGAALIGRAVLGFGGGMKWLLENSVSQYLGKISYGLYLFHNFIFNHYHSPEDSIVLRAWARAERVLPVLGEYYVFQVAYFALLTVGVATVSWYVVEKPFNALKDRFSYGR